MKVARAPGRLRSAAGRASAPAPSTARRHRDRRRYRRRTRAHDSGAVRRRSGCRALQVEHEVGAVTALAIPHLERRGARGAECRVMVLIALGLQRLAPPDPLAAALLAGLAPGAGWGAGAGGEADGAGGSAPAEVPDAGAKGPSDDGGRDELVESRASFSACSIASACSRHSSSTRAQRLEEAPVHAGKINGPRARHTAIESEPAGECHPHIVRPIPRATPSMRGEVNGYAASNNDLCWQVGVQKLCT